jgi:hypothetical protein
MAGPAVSNELPDFDSSFPAATAALEESVHALLSSGWEEGLRRRAYEIASAMSAGAKEAGWKQAAGVLQAMASLLSLPLKEVLSVRDELRNKLLELLEQLREDPLAQRA